MKQEELRRWLIPMFWAAVAFALVMALLPKPPQLPGSPSDKIQHVLAFSVLAALGTSAYPRASLLRLGAWLSLFGAMIEALQAIPQLHRDASLLDWLADSAAVAAVLALVRLWRDHVRR